MEIDLQAMNRRAFESFSLPPTPSNRRNWYQCPISGIHNYHTLIDSTASLPKSFTPSPATRNAMPISAPALANREGSGISCAAVQAAAAAVASSCEMSGMSHTGTLDAARAAATAAVEGPARTQVDEMLSSEAPSCGRRRWAASGDRREEEEERKTKVEQQRRSKLAAWNAAAAASTSRARLASLSSSPSWEREKRDREEGKRKR